MPIKKLRLKDLKVPKQNRKIKVLDNGALKKLTPQQIAAVYKELFAVFKKNKVKCRLNQKHTAIICESTPVYPMARFTQYRVEAMKDYGFDESKKAYVTKTIWSALGKNPLLVMELETSGGGQKWLIKAEFENYSDELRNHYFWSNKEMKDADGNR